MNTYNSVTAGCNRYSLAKKGKWDCPQCGKKRCVLYIDNSTGKPLHPSVGKCDRLNSCMYHYTPKQYFSDNNISFDKNTTGTPYIKPAPKTQPPPSYIDADIFKMSLNKYEENRFIKYLHRVVGTEKARDAIRNYYIGTSSHWDGATVFWQIDQSGRVHAGKVMQYDDKTGKRVKEPENRITWTHKLLNLQDFNLSQCLFGQHLLTDKSKPVAVVESEKTAVIASCYYPDAIWLACGGLSNLSIKLCESLRGRKVVLYPDAGCYEKWSDKAKELSSICNVFVSWLIEKGAKGSDIADYLVMFPIDEFNTPTEISGTPNSVRDFAVTPENQHLPKFGQMSSETEISITEAAPLFDNEIGIEELESLLKNRAYPNCPVKLDQCTTVINSELFIDSGLNFLKHNPKRVSNGFMPILRRLRQFEQITRNLTTKI